MWINRTISQNLTNTLSRSKSILLFGPRQTGKTSVVKKLAHDTYITLMDPAKHRQYESAPESLLQEVKAQKYLLNRKPIIILDEIQKVPDITDVIQILIDEDIAQFILTGSSARKIKNLLPGRVIKYTLSPLSLVELEGINLNLEAILTNGLLPEVYTTTNQFAVNELLESYVNLYIEEEVRKEALVRNVGNFTNFLNLACIESGNIINLRAIAYEIGMSHQTIAEYYRILQDCMLIEKINALTKSITRKRLNKSPKFILFDLGVKRIGAGEPSNPGIHQQASLFEQFIGLELSKIIRLRGKLEKLFFWRSHDGPEVDFVLEENGLYIPIEVKWTDKPTQRDTKHLVTFKKEYPLKNNMYVICRCAEPMLLADNIMALPWQHLAKIFTNPLSEA